MHLWLEGFQQAFSGANLFFLLLGTCIGLIVGVLPVVGPSFAVALALPFTVGMDSAASLILLTSIQSSCTFGDSIASILLNVPGGPGTVASMWDGYPMTRQGRAGTALGIAAAASFVGGLLGWLSFVLLAGPMTAFAYGCTSLVSNDCDSIFELRDAAIWLDRYLYQRCRVEPGRSQTHRCMSQYGVVPQPTGSAFNIGTMAYDSWFKGAIGKVAIYDHVLSQAQISSHYRAMTGKDPTGTCATSCHF